MIIPLAAGFVSRLGEGRRGRRPGEGRTRFGDGEGWGRLGKEKLGESGSWEKGEEEKV
jgi:hypothetical protein